MYEAEVVKGYEAKPSAHSGVEQFQRIESEVIAARIVDVLNKGDIESMQIVTVPKGHFQDHIIIYKRPDDNDANNQDLTQ
jgi:hypothetical protein